MTRNVTWMELFANLIYGFAFVMIVTTVFLGIFGFDLVYGNEKTGSIKNQDSRIPTLNSSASSKD